MSCGISWKYNFLWKNIFWRICLSCFPCFGFLFVCYSVKIKFACPFSFIGLTVRADFFCAQNELLSLIACNPKNWKANWSTCRNIVYSLRFPHSWWLSHFRIFTVNLNIYARRQVCKDCRDHRSGGWYSYLRHSVSCTRDMDMSWNHSNMLAILCC